MLEEDLWSVLMASLLVGASVTKPVLPLALLKQPKSTEVSNFVSGNLILEMIWGAGNLF